VNHIEYDLLTEEELAILKSAEDIFKMFLTDLWTTTPKRFVSTSIPEDAPLFLVKNLEFYLQDIEVRPGRKYTWLDRFGWFFPRYFKDIPKGQGWSSLKYYDKYMAWFKVYKEKGRDELWALFEKLDCLPGGTPVDKLWVVRKKYLLITEKGKK
jgi:hypothetical protein